MAQVLKKIKKLYGQLILLLSKILMISLMN